MKNIKRTIVTTALLLASYANANKVETVQTVATFTERPGNLTINNEGRVFVSIHPLINPDIKLVELSAIGSKNNYPNDKYSKGKDSLIKATIAVKSDAKGNLWILDLANKQFVVWDTKKNKLEKTIKISEEAMVKASFLQDFVLDEKRNRAIIADMSQGDLKSAPTPAFIVVNTKTGESKRVAQSHKSMMPEIKDGFALNPIAIDPTFTWVYFGSIHGKKVYRVPSDSFDNEKDVIKNIKVFGQKSYSDGIAVDSNENVYITDIENQAIGVTNKDGYKIIATLPKGQTWPDGLAIANDGYIYATVNQLNRTAVLNNGKEEGISPYLIVKTKLLK
ncbi:L-dopachrome tautomerase-related protein [Poseidonibacter lekithochrous]|uniref:L-dopachrome tautomerase-related protein n=1 Tax=Poseidonibacter lekithochrous TaxID=1904463 RepID=UPI000AB3B7EC|nr:L-dopachrome tautomerase-related protein [Poseidonibacter lekithochrous]QKJ23632.1 major royal jelly-related protein [Poseidonibacter lekithochrous]